MDCVRGVTTLDFLLGTWSVERTIDDRLSGEAGTFHGTASFSREPGDERVRFDESGVVRFGDYSGHATRLLYYSRGVDSSFNLSFANGHHFIQLLLTEGSSSDSHQCRSDEYHITTTVLSDDLLEERWRVLGPAKDYDALTRLMRVRPSPDAGAN
jgi:hypothetical protein